jgi:hypothetical protein
VVCGGLPGPDAVEYEESYPLSYGDGAFMSSMDLAERDKNGELGGVCWLRCWLGLANRVRLLGLSRLWCAR